MGSFNFLLEKVTPSISKMTDEQYDEIKAIRSSNLKWMLKSPSKFEYNFNNPKPATQAMNLGKIFHKAMLEKDLFLNSYIVQPDFGDCRLKDNKSARDLWRFENQNKTILTSEQYECLVGMVNSISNDEKSMSFLSRGIAEQGCVVNDKATGVAIKGKPDFVSASGEIMIDIKTTRYCEEDFFNRAIYNYDYHFQLAHHANALRQVTGRDVKFHVIIAVENVPPFDCQTYLLKKAAIDYGMDRVEFALRKVKHGIETGSFKKESVIKEADLPAYAYLKEQEEIEEFENE